MTVQPVSHFKDLHVDQEEDDSPLVRFLATETFKGSHQYTPYLEVPNMIRGVAAEGMPFFVLFFSSRSSIVRSIYSTVYKLHLTWFPSFRLSSIDGW